MDASHPKKSAFEATVEVMKSYFQCPPPRQSLGDKAELIRIIYDRFLELAEEAHVEWKTA